MLAVRCFCVDIFINSLFIHFTMANEQRLTTHLKVLWVTATAGEMRQSDVNVWDVRKEALDWMVFLTWIYFQKHHSPFYLHACKHMWQNCGQWHMHTNACKWQDFAYSQKIMHCWAGSDFTEQHVIQVRQCNTRTAQRHGPCLLYYTHANFSVRANLMRHMISFQVLLLS